MSFTEDQFGKLMKFIEMRDLLIRIDENTKNNHERFTKHLEEDSRIHERAELKIGALHKRVDGMFVSGVLAIILLTLTSLFSLVMIVIKGS